MDKKHLLEMYLEFLKISLKYLQYRELHKIIYHRMFNLIKYTKQYFIINSIIADNTFFNILLY